MKYLFLDIEWNQLHNQFNLAENEILEIAAISVDSEFKNEKSFFKLIRPEHLEKVPNSTLTFLKIEKDALEGASLIADVMSEFNQVFMKFEIIIVWNRLSYELFAYAVKHSGLTLPKHKVVVLQEVLSIIDRAKKGNVSGFEKAMMRYHVKYDLNLLHCSKYDAEYLKKLYCSVKYQYKYQCEVESLNKMVRLDNSAMLHSTSCHYIAGKNTTKKASEIDILYGYSICKHCLRKGDFVTMPKQLEFENRDMKNLLEEKVTKICERYKMDCHFSDRVIFVRTKIACWRIYHDGYKIIDLFHENYRKIKNKSHKRRNVNEGFHKQDKQFNNIYEVLDYIYKHDKYFFNENRCTQNRIDMLFAMLEKEKQEKERKIEDECGYESEELAEICMDGSERECV